MKIISTNISKIKTVTFEGKEVKTGIFKTPTADEVTIEQCTIIGDEQADLKNHGGEEKAIYAFSSDHYDYWKDLLGNSDLANGAFGENFTITNLNESEVMIGDQYRLGTALLEVSQPRVPCFKLGIALNNKDAVKLFTKSYCTGVYFRVLETGVAKTDDTVSLVKKASHNISIKNLFQAYYDRSFEGSERLFAEAFALPELALEWKDKLEKRLSFSS